MAKNNAASVLNQDNTGHPFKKTYLNLSSRSRPVDNSRRGGNQAANSARGSEDVPQGNRANGGRVTNRERVGNRGRTGNGQRQNSGNQSANGPRNPTSNTAQNRPASAEGSRNTPSIAPQTRPALSNSRNNNRGNGNSKVGNRGRNNGGFSRNRGNAGFPSYGSFYEYGLSPVDVIYLDYYGAYGPALDYSFGSSGVGPVFIPDYGIDYMVDTNGF